MFELKKKIPVAVLGATGRVGQKFIQLLFKHPWFEIKAIAASDRSTGKLYKEAVQWVSSEPIPPFIARMELIPCISDFPCSLLFSGLDANVAGDIEKELANRGHIVVSNCKNHRMDSTVPLLIPEVNQDHLQILEYQKFNGGKIVTNPNCVAIGVALAVKALHEKFGIEKLNVVTMQAMSGAGVSGLSNPDFVDNVVPYIADEEKKVEEELLKIFGEFKDDKIINETFPISAQCNRVPVLDGHTKCISVKLKTFAGKVDILQAWSEFADKSMKGLPSAPKKVLYYFSEDNYPQPKLHRGLDNGMAIAVGRLRECSLFDYKFVALSHNTARGGAGVAILNAELMAEKGLIPK